jgi:hypothetical protein
MSEARGALMKNLIPQMMGPTVDLMVMMGMRDVVGGIIPHYLNEIKIKFLLFI